MISEIKTVIYFFKKKQKQNLFFGYKNKNTKKNEINSLFTI